MKAVFKRLLYDLSDSTELPLAELCRSYCVNVTDKSEVRIDGVISICKYERELVVVEVCSQYVYIYGKKMYMKNLYKGSLCVRGDIDRVEYGSSLCL